MKFLRTVSTRRLLATLAGLVIAVAAGSAIAVAAAGNGPVPPRKALAPALRQALTAKAPIGISANITFTNNLISSTVIQGLGNSDPLLTGATGRLWMTKDRFRLELQSNNGDAQLVANRSGFWVYDPSSNTVYKGTWAGLGAGKSKAGKKNTKSKTAKDDGIPTISQIQTELNKLASHLNLSGARPTDVAGQAAYSVKLSPKHDGGLLGDVQLAWDATHGIPLDFGIYASGSSTPVLELKATGISYGRVPLSDLKISPPSSAKVVKVASSSVSSARTARVKALKSTLAGAKAASHVSGVSAVAAKLGFPLSAKSQIGGLRRQSVKLLDWGGSPAALVLYGKGLGGVAVIERAAKAGAKSPLPSTTSSNGSSLNLPTVSINGATGTELDTQLGSLLQFTRSGVSYLVVGSVPGAAIEAVSRDL